MRIVIVNHCHPAMPHVCATRAREFGQALARRGHRVVLLTGTPDLGSGEAVAANEIPHLLAGHDWRHPFSLACPAQPRRLLAAAREGRLVRWLRRPLLAGTYLVRGGVFTDWRAGSRSCWKPLAREFRPQVVWAVFGNTDAVVIGRAIARDSGCRWVLDVKDPWSAFIPAPLRRLLATRFADFGAVTALSEYHAADVERCFGRKAVVVRSGVAPLPPPPPAAPGTVRLLVVGGLYAEDDFESLLQGIRVWLDGLSGDQRAHCAVVYAGSEIRRFRDAAARLAVPAETAGYVTLDRLAALAAGCAAVLYVRSRRAGYQHKLVELAAFGRPVVCLPRESAESIDLMSRLGGRLAGCDTACEVAAALAAIHRAPPAPPVSREALAEYTWDSQAGRLAEILARTSGAAA